MKKERKRARTKKGRYVADDPRTKDIDEAWEPVKKAEPKKVKPKEVKPEVNQNTKPLGQTLLNACLRTLIGYAKNSQVILLSEKKPEPQRQR